jgi:hypothetical protein
MKLKALAATTLITVGLAGFVRADEPSSTSKAATNAPPKAATAPSAKSTRSEKKDNLPVIGYLEKRDRVITIKSGPKGAVYTVADKAGKVLFENVSIEQLKAQAPELHQLIKTGVADARVAPVSRGSAKLDASN